MIRTVRHIIFVTLACIVAVSAKAQVTAEEQLELEQEAKQEILQL